MNHTNCFPSNVQESAFVVGELKGTYSSWNYGDDQYGIYIIIGVKGDMNTEIK